jgi:hypothetical protein
VTGLNLNREIAIVNIHKLNHSTKETKETHAHTIRPNIGKTDPKVGKILNIRLNQIKIKITHNNLISHVLREFAFSASNIIFSADLFHLLIIDIAFHALV